MSALISTRNLILLFACLPATYSGHRVRYTSEQEFQLGELRNTRRSLLTERGPGPASAFAYGTAATRDQHRPQQHRRSNKILMAKGRGPPSGQQGNGMRRPTIPGGGIGLPTAPKLDLPEDGTPVFMIYVRTQEGKPWYPVNALRGDSQTKQILQGWLTSPLGKGTFKDRLDEGIARSVFGSEKDIKKMAVQMLPMLKKVQKLEWGYKPQSTLINEKIKEGEIKEPEIMLLDKEWTKGRGVLDQARNWVSDTFGGGGED